MAMTGDERLVIGPAGPPGDPPALDMVWVPGGEFLMGSNDHYPEEAPAHPVTVDGFWMDETAVTHAELERFVAACPVGGRGRVSERVRNELPQTLTTKQFPVSKFISLIRRGLHSPENDGDLGGGIVVADQVSYA